MGIPDPEPLPIAVRAYAPPPAAKRKVAGPPDWTLIFDCETTRDIAHSLRFGAFQVREGSELHRSGFFYDPEGLQSEELALLQQVAGEDGIECVPVAQFIEELFFRYVHELGALCVGFNLPFDLSRLAIRDVKARGRYKGGFSFELSDNRERPRVRVLHRDSTSSFIELVPRRKPRKGDHRGYFIDARTLGKAILGEACTLARLANLLQTESRKADVEEHGGPLTRHYINYCALDVQVTWECFHELRQRFAGYVLTQTPLTSLTSEASIGKGSLREMNIDPWRTIQPRFPAETIGQIISSYYGGRSEVRLRLQIAEVSYNDFRSMYPTICTLMGLFEFVTAHGMTARDATEETRAALDAVSVDGLQRPEIWKQLRVLVRLKPDADRFPVRAAFGGLGDDPTHPATSYGMSQSHLTSEDGMWFTLADCIASKLATGKTPEILSATAFEPRAPQDGMQPIDILGNPAYHVDPYADDFYRRLIDLRAEVKTRAAQAEADGDADLAARLDAAQQALKLTANASSYGCFIELNPNDRETAHLVKAYGLDGQGFQTMVARDEQPGRYFHPLLGTLITGAARLMLAIAEHLAHDEGLDWAFMDTDSIALMRPTGLPREQFHARVDVIHDWFAELNPYESKGSLLELEKVNRALTADGKTSDELEPLYCLAVSPKRYVLFNIDADGLPVIRKASAHGLGHLLAPYDDNESPADIPTPLVPVHKLGVSRWQHDLWYRAIQAQLAGTPDLDLDSLPGFDRPAMSSYTISTHNIARWFDKHNEHKPYREQARAFGFHISPITGAFGKPLGLAGKPFHLVAPYDKTQSAWATTKFTDIYGGGQYDISTTTYDAGTARVRTYHDIAKSYLTHPDPRRLDEHGQPSRRKTRGLLSPRHIHAIHIEQIGKETNRLEEAQAGLIHNSSDIYTSYTTPRRDPWTRLVLPVLADVPAARLAAITGISKSAVSDVLAERTQPRPDNRAQLQRAAYRHAVEQLAAWGEPASRNRLAVLHTYLDARNKYTPPAVCAGCGEPVASSRATYCSAACKQRAFRSRAGREASPRSEQSADRSSTRGS